MIQDNKISLPVCAFGAGLAHAAALALILPIIITLPAPEADTAPRTVAIHVEIRTVTPEPAMPEGDAEDTGALLDALGSAEVTAALPAPVETEDLNGGTEPAGPEDALAPEPAPDDDAQLGAVANVDTESMPAAVPVPLRKPPQSAAAEENKPARAAIAVPEKHVVPVYRPRARAPAKSKGFLGGRTATSMPEYPFSAGP